jgi:iron-sulfur cluster repair protein YtfE (RIC family)
MTGLIGELRAEHSKIFDTLLRVRLLGVDRPDGHRQLLSARDMLLEHLSKEDNKLYPVLHEAAKKDEELRNSLELLSLDREEVSLAAARFFKKYSWTAPGKKDSGKKDNKESRPKGLFRLFANNKGAVEKDAYEKPSAFAADFEELHHLLLTRIQKEEKVLFKAFQKLTK